MKDETIKFRDLKIRCRRNSSYHVEIVNAPYAIQEDGTPIYFRTNGCENLDGSTECSECCEAIPLYLFRHPDTDVNKPILPVFSTEETW
ncbi:MAG: hypothetical protein RSE64_06055 [Oscillospiraceae bacterium]